MDKSEKTILLVVIGIVVGCLLISALCASIFLISEKIVSSNTSVFPEVPTPAMPTVAVCSVAVQDAKIPIEVDQRLLQTAWQTQGVLGQVTLPTADLNKIEERLSGRRDIPTQMASPPVQYQIGDQKSFYKFDADNNEVSTSARLLYATDKVYFWAEEDISLNQDDLKFLVDTFSDQIYPNTQAMFGSEWIPGVDNDPHLFILFARGLGDSLAGYSSSTDYVLPEVYSYSNAHEMYVLNADEVSITDPYILSTMAHELQHVILGYRDPDEELWLNEGFSELATLINGFDAGGFDYYFTSNPDFQLNNWMEDPDQSDLNYGASYLFTTYFYGRFGIELTQNLVSNPLNGFGGLEDVFKNAHVLDPSTGSLLTANTFFQDWTITNYINDQSVEEGRYFYSQYLDVPLVNQAEWLNECQGFALTESVHQFGADYFQIACDNPVKLQFSGDPTINILPDLNENQSFFMWSNRGDTLDTSMTREFDLTGYTGSITMSFDTWYDLEEDFDFGYVLVSQDEQSWRVLDINYCDNPRNYGTNFGCTYSGSTESWVTQTVNLSEFAGTKIWLRFEMISDGALSNEGMAIDNIKIPALGYEETFETDEGGWSTAGFSRMSNIIPQSFLVSIITAAPNLSVEKYSVMPGEALELLIDPNCYSDDPILIVSGSSWFTRQTARYTISLNE
jgi:hypothetical protein